MPEVAAGETFPRRHAAAPRTWVCFLGLGTLAVVVGRASACLSTSMQGSLAYRLWKAGAAHNRPAMLRLQCVRDLVSQQRTSLLPLEIVAAIAKDDVTPDRVRRCIQIPRRPAGGAPGVYANLLQIGTETRLQIGPHAGIERTPTIGHCLP